MISLKSIFDPSNNKTFKINGYQYMIHESILKKIDIFAPMFDDAFDQQDVNIIIPDHDIEIIRIRNA